MTICERLLRRCACGLALALVLTLGSRIAAAQAQDEASARALFAEGRRLVKEGSYDKACPKLEAASKLYPGSGVLLNLADCFEHLNRLASAWAVFGDAAANARRASRADDEAEAKRRQSALEPRLSRIAIHVVKDVPTLVVKRDQTIVDRGAWDTALPVDAGTHVITADATGRAPWSSNVTVTGVGQSLTVDVPELREAAVRVAGSPTASPTDESSPASGESMTSAEKPRYWTSRRAAGAAIFGVGAVGIGVGGVLGLLAKSEFNTALGETGAAQRNDSTTAVHGGNAATVVMAVGGVAAAAGIILWLTAPNGSVAISTTGRGIAARCTF
jgi:hypothetical protein